MRGEADGGVPKDWQQGYGRHPIFAFSPFPGRYGVWTCVRSMMYQKETYELTQLPSYESPSCGSLSVIKDYTADWSIDLVDGKLILVRGGMSRMRGTIIAKQSTALFN